MIYFSLFLSLLVSSSSFALKEERDKESSSYQHQYKEPLYEPNAHLQIKNEVSINQMDATDLKNGKPISLRVMADTTDNRLLALSLHLTDDETQERSLHFRMDSRNVDDWSELVTFLWYRNVSFLTITLEDIWEEDLLFNFNQLFYLLEVEGSLSVFRLPD